MNSYTSYYILLISVSCFVQLSYTQITNRDYSAQQIGAAYHNSFPINDIFINANPATLRSISGSHLFFSSEKRYFSEIQSVIGGFNLPLDNNSGLSMSISDHGISDWHDNQIILSYGRALNNHIGIGMSFSAHHFRITEYGSKSEFDIALGITYELSSSLEVSYYVSGINSSNEISSTFHCIGLQINLSDRLTMQTEFNHQLDSNNNTSYNFSICYKPLEVINILLGINTRLAGPTIGFGTEVIKNVDITLSASKHQNLGTSGSLSLAYSFN